MKRFSVRTRLTVMYGALCIVISAALLVVPNMQTAQLHRRMPGMPAAFVQDNLRPARPPPRSVPSPRGSEWLLAVLAVIALASIVVIWWLAGRLLDRLEKSVDRHRRFIAHAAHELRAPLAIQRAAIQIGLDQPSLERLARIREELLEINRRNERLIDGLLALARGEHGLQATEPVALDALVRQVVSEISANGILIRVDTGPSTVNGDAVLLHRLVANLVDNAIRYNQRNGVVDIEVTANGTLTVRNTGPEIPENRINQIFEPFRRLHAARSGSTESAGLGLSIVAAIAHAHGAHLTARPNPGGGLELTVQFRGTTPDHQPYSSCPGQHT